MEKNKTNTEHAILEAAEELFLENGYHVASTTMIAKKAGVTHAMLHYYYRTKEQIFLKVVEKNFDSMLSEIKLVMSSGRNFWDIIKDVTLWHFDYLATHRRVPYLILEVSQGFPEVVKAYKDKVLADAQEELSKHRDRFASEFISGRVNFIDPLQLLFTAISLNMAPFLSLPYLENVLDMNQEQIEAFLETRKRENLEILYKKLFCKVNKEEI